MCPKSNVKKAMLISYVLLAAFLGQPTQQAQASGVLVVDKGRHDRPVQYTEVVVGSGRYYYDQGVFYTGEPGRYVATEAPAGAVVYSVPSGYERVEIDGSPYLRYRDVYYRPSGRGSRCASEAPDPAAARSRLSTTAAPEVASNILVSFMRTSIAER